MYSTGITLNAASYKNLLSSAGSLYVPVKPSAVLYAQFDYVHGTAAGPNQEGVSLNRIKILNSLINQLASLRHKDAQEVDVDNLSDNYKDDLIREFQTQIQETISKAETEDFSLGLAGLMPLQGQIVSIQA